MVEEEKDEGEMKEVKKKEGVEEEKKEERNK